MRPSSPDSAWRRATTPSPSTTRWTTSCAAAGRTRSVRALDEVGPERRMLVEQGWRTDDPAVLPVLDALGRNHPDRGMAKAARKAALRTAVASPTGRGDRGAVH